jgi:Replication-relaxation
MRYIKDCISLNPEHDFPLLRQVLHSGFVAHDQLFEFMHLGKHESSRSTFNWRVRRLTAHGLIARHAIPSVSKAFVYSITPAGALELGTVGEEYVTLPKESRNWKLRQVAHSLEIRNIHLSLLRAGLLMRWMPEFQLRSRNVAHGAVNEKVYDAIVTVRLEERAVTFALEYERTAKGEVPYAEVVRRFECETDLDRFLYLAPSEELLKSVSWHFRNSRSYVCFGLLADWYRRLLDIEVFDWICHQYRPFRGALISSACPAHVPAPAIP